MITKKVLHEYIELQEDLKDNSLHLAKLRVAVAGSLPQFMAEPNCNLQFSAIPNCNEASETASRLRQTAPDCTPAGLPQMSLKHGWDQIARNCTKLHQTVPDCAKRCQTGADCAKLQQTALNCSRLR